MEKQTPMNESMEITNEIKAKVFAQYLGQMTTLRKAGTEQNLPLTFDRLRHSEEFELWNAYQLILKPLSAISDEDCIEAYYMTQVRLLSKDKDSYSIDRKKNPINIIQVCSLETPDEYLTIHTEKVDLNRWFYDGKKEAELESGYHNFIGVYQFLQSRGYDLPNFHLGGKTLHECNLCIYE